MVHPVVASAVERLGTAPALADAHAAFLRGGDALRTRMRVALVGRVSAGKSTLANALLGGYRAPTGVNELTFNVNWITSGDRPTVTVHFRDERQPELRDVADLERLTVRADDNPADPEAVRWRQYLSSIAYLRITDPAPLRSFDLIDTPGLDSFFGTDSANTLAFLDGPINTIAALTRVEGYWEWPDVPDPHRVAQRVADQARGAPGVAHVIYELVPVASLVGAAAAVIDERDLHDLVELARIPADALGWSLDDADGFAEAELPGPSPARRAELFRMLHGYGVMLACDLIRDGVSDVATLGSELDRRSGMTGFRQFLVDHFGNRADLLKLNRAHSQVRALPGELGPRLDPRARLALTDAVREFTRYGLAQSPRFRELEVIRAHYEAASTGRPATRSGWPAGPTNG